MNLKEGEFRILYIYSKIDNMKLTSSKVLTLIFLFIGNLLFAQTNSAKLLHKAEGFSHPESVVYDEQDDVLYVSNMADDKEGDGFISKITSEGEIVELKWITGLKDPKGLLVHDNKLYVTNNTELVEMDIEKGEIARRIPVEGAVSLNDITVDAGGTIFFSDMGQNSIYWIPGKMASNSMLKTAPEGEVSEYVKTPELNTPNGLLAHRDYLYVGSWGENQDGDLLRMDLDTREVEKVTEEGVGNLDGIQTAGGNSFYVSNWSTGKIYKIDQQGNAELILTSEKSSGDILFLENRNQLILPMNFQNEVWWYELE